MVAASAITYLEGYLWDPKHAKEAFLKAAKIAHGDGRKVALSLSDEREGLPRYRSGRHRGGAGIPGRAGVDTTGAGDLFAAGFLCGLARGADDRSCGRLGALAEKPHRLSQWQFLSSPSGVINQRGSEGEG
jgi:sugar/nucleoside kinase (ribokinase family)